MTRETFRYLGRNAFLSWWWCSAGVYVTTYYLHNSNNETWRESHLIPLLLPCDLSGGMSSFQICGTKCRMDMHVPGGRAQPGMPWIKGWIQCSLFMLCTTVCCASDPVLPTCRSWVRDAAGRVCAGAAPRRAPRAPLHGKDGCGTQGSGYGLLSCCFSKHYTIIYISVSGSSRLDFVVEICRVLKCSYEVRPTCQ